MTKSDAMRDVLCAMRLQLEAGEVIGASPGIRSVFSCFSPEGAAEHPSLEPGSLDGVLATLGVADIPAIDAAIKAIDDDAQAWLGFKVVTDRDRVLCGEATAFSATFMGETEASADCEPLLFFADEQHRIVASRPYSKRDRFQMLDITRGPHMHADQFSGIAWASQSLVRIERAFIMGAGPVAMEVAALAAHVGFRTIVVDCDPIFLSEARFPLSERRLVERFDALGSLHLGPEDYVLVLTRGHMYDPEVLVQALRSSVRYLGMIGTGSKNSKAFRMARTQGVSEDELETVHTPIGIDCGAKSPQELAVAIVAELIAQRATLHPPCHQW
jgi:xanthine dehydrogenase accessory factor